jgi:DNA-binding GntR family transcriptional regulator
VRQVSRFNEEQIIDVLRQHEAGARIAASTQRLDRAINASRTFHQME